MDGERRARLRRLPEQPGDLLERVLAPERQRRGRHAAQAPAAGGVVDRGAEQDAGQAVGQHERAVGERRALGRRRQPHGAERAQALVGTERDEHVGDRDAAAREQPGDRARGRGAGGRGGRREAGERGAELRPELAQGDGGEDRRLELVEAEALGGEREARLHARDAALGAEREVEVGELVVAAGDGRRARGDGPERHALGGEFGHWVRRGRGRRFIHVCDLTRCAAARQGPDGRTIGTTGQTCARGSHLDARSYMDTPLR